MPRPLPYSLDAALDDTVTKPGYLVEVGFATPLRGCSRGTVTVGGLVFPARGFDIKWGQDGATASPDLTVDFNDLDFTVATLTLAETIADKTIKVWVLYNDPANPGDAVDAREAVLLFEGRGDEASIDPDSGATRITAYVEGSATVYAPRVYMTKENGFNHLPAQGSVITWGGEDFVFQPEV